MFPHPCGEELEKRVLAGADARTVVPDEYVVVRGGLKPVPDPGARFSCVVGPTLIVAGCAVPHGNIRATSAGAIRVAGGAVVWDPETSPHGTMNLQHVNVTESGSTTFSEPQPNPVARKQRIDEGN